MRFLASLFLIAFSITPVHILLGAVIHVPGGAATIQEGISLADPGDTVLVADGIYTGTGNRNLDFSGKNVVLMSENGRDATIIDCQADSSRPSRGFYFHSGEDSTCVVKGFTIKGGYVDGDGAGVFCDGSSPTILECRITGNSTSHVYDRNGGGIYCSNSDARIIDCEVSNNEAGECAPNPVHGERCLLLTSYCDRHPLSDEVQG
jgi:nitrous oxidase accessory protein NosD